MSLDILPLPGVYVISFSNSESGRVYIGSSRSMYHRRIEHLSMVRRNTHRNKPLVNAYNKYKHAAFTFTPIYYTETAAEALELEQLFLDYYNEVDWKLLYNIDKLARAHSPIKYITPEQQKMVKQIRWGRDKNILRKYMAEFFGLSETTVRGILDANVGRYIDGSEPCTELLEYAKTQPRSKRKRKKSGNQHKSVINPTWSSDVRKIRWLAQQGCSHNSIADIFGVSSSVVNNVANYHTAIEVSGTTECWDIFLACSSGFYTSLIEKELIEELFYSGYKRSVIATIVGRKVSNIDRHISKIKNDETLFET